MQVQAMSIGVSTGRCGLCNALDCQTHFNPLINPRPGYRQSSAITGGLWRGNRPKNRLSQGRFHALADVAGSHWLRRRRSPSPPGYDPKQFFLFKYLAKQTRQSPNWSPNCSLLGGTRSPLRRGVGDHHPDFETGQLALLGAAAILLRVDLLLTYRAE